MFPRYVSATTSALAAGSALIAETTWAAVLVRAPEASVARVTRMSFPVTLTLNGEFATPSRNSAVTSFPPSWPHARVVRTTV
jgi:hypothetical protein